MTRNLTIARQMIAADLLRLRKKRGFIALVMVVVLAPLVIATGYNVDPARIRSGSPTARRAVCTTTPGCSTCLACSWDLSRRS